MDDPRQDAADAVQAANAKLANKGKKKGKKGKGKGKADAGAKLTGSPVEVMKQVFLPLCKKGMLLVMNMEEIEEDSDTAKLCCQVLQCVDAMFEELAEEEEGGVVAGVLMGWSEEEIKGPSIDPEDKGEEISLPVEP